MKSSESKAVAAGHASHYPAADPKARFTPQDFFEVIAELPEECPIIGGQAVAWWAARYQLRTDDGEVITSSDIDFWGGREELKRLAKALRLKPVFPLEYEMTVWSGALPIQIRGTRTLAEFLHTVPGLDTNNPDNASAEQDYAAGPVRKIISVLSPVSLVLAKLHALRHFEQKEREDELHLRISLQASNRFLQELLDQQEIRQVLWNCERLIAAAHLKPYRRLQSEHKFNLLDAIPIEAMRRGKTNKRLSAEDKRRLTNFTEVRWKQVIGESQISGGKLAVRHGFEP